MSTTESSYVPGGCNINKAEIAKRRMIGHVGLVIFVIVLVALLVFDVSRWYRIILFLPGMMVASGYLQARNHFCTGYARAGKQNAVQGSTTASDISDEAAKASDKSKAKRMNLQASLIALIAMVITLFL
jgi:hypothetical protein